eukprot:731494-Pyramimonas_sp.AAC.1
MALTLWCNFRLACASLRCREFWHQELVERHGLRPAAHDDVVATLQHRGEARPHDAVNCTAGHAEGDDPLPASPMWHAVISRAHGHWEHDVTHALQHPDGFVKVGFRSGCIWGLVN